MKYTANEVIQYVREEDVRFIHLAFCDVFGNQKNITILPDELERALSCGIAFDGSAVKGFGSEVHSDLFLHPECDTFALLPWRPEQGKIAKMFCNITYPDGSVFENDGRSILKKAIAQAEEKGYHFQFGAELEFYLFKTDENGEPTKTPYDNAGYMDVAPQDKCDNLRREVCLTLRQMGIQPESSHHEEGPGQNEIDFRYSDPLTCADNAVTFEGVVKSASAANGLYADFSPKPLAGKPGNGLHINVSVKSYDGRDVLAYVIAGVLDKIPEMTLFLNPSEKSYERLGSLKAPKYISWSRENRSQLIRIPAASGEYERMELRSADPSANPYIAFALIIYAGLYGIEKSLALPDAADFNLYTADEKTLSRFRALPQNRAQAGMLASSSEFIKQHLPQMMVHTYFKN